MKLLIQRVKKAQVDVDLMTVGQINKGLLLFFGVHKEDKEDKIPWLVNKVLHLRIFADEQGKMNLNVKDVQGGILIVSQFTLYGNCLTGRRPDFIESASPSLAIPLYEKFIEEMQKQHEDIQTGVFGADMQVSLINDGPVTFILEK